MRPAHTMTAPAPASPLEGKSPFLLAARGKTAPHTPVWLMRQAGRYMAEYRALREKHTILEIIRNAELSVEVTLQPINAFALDAAIIFADILPPLVGMGLELSFEAGEGPVIANPIRTTKDVDMLAVPPAQETMPATLCAIEMVSAELNGRGIPLIGFAGAPFTLASYAIEGGSSRNFIKTKSLMYSEPAAWKRLMTKLVTVQSDYLLAQAKAGAATLQLFDSWAGQALGKEDYKRYVQPYNTLLLQKIQAAGVPVINFSTGTSAFLPEVAACGGDVVGVDWHMPLGLVLGADRPRAAHPGQSGPSGAAGPLAGTEAPHRQCACPGGRATRPHLQPGPRHLPPDAGGECAAVGGLCA
jgi:uroporphyrinogen decarboxylase